MSWIFDKHLLSFQLENGSSCPSFGEFLFLSTPFLVPVHSLCVNEEQAYYEEMLP
jgi:hypothetical protein